MQLSQLAAQDVRLCAQVSAQAAPATAAEPEGTIEKEAGAIRCAPAIAIRPGQPCPLVHCFKLDGVL